MILKPDNGWIHSLIKIKSGGRGRPQSRGDKEESRLGFAYTWIDRLPRSPAVVRLEEGIFFSFFSPFFWIDDDGAATGPVFTLNFTCGTMIEFC